MFLIDFSLCYFFRKSTSKSVILANRSPIFTEQKLGGLQGMLK
jgi:hypothetical protein